MEEILHQLVKIFHYVEGFIHPRWCRISSIHVVPTTNPTSSKEPGLWGHHWKECWKTIRISWQSKGMITWNSIRWALQWHRFIDTCHSTLQMKVCLCSLTSQRSTAGCTVFLQASSWIQDSLGASGKRTTWMHTEHWHSLVAKASDEVQMSAEMMGAEMIGATQPEVAKKGTGGCNSRMCFDFELQGQAQCHTGELLTTVIHSFQVLPLQHSLRHLSGCSHYLGVLLLIGVIHICSHPKGPKGSDCKGILPKMAETLRLKIAFINCPDI